MENSTVYSHCRTSHYKPRYVSLNFRPPYSKINTIHNYVFTETLAFHKPDRINLAQLTALSTQ